MALNLKHQTRAQFAAKFRAAYKTAKGAEAAKLAAWLIGKIESGDFTDAQVQSAFGLTAPQYAAQKARMTTVRDQYNAVIAAAGE